MFTHEDVSRIIPSRNGTSSCLGIAGDLNHSNISLNSNGTGRSGGSVAIFRPNGANKFINDMSSTSQYRPEAYNQKVSEFPTSSYWTSTNSDPVSQYPKINSFSGDYNFKISFPQESPKVIVVSENLITVEILKHSLLLYKYI